MRQQTSVADTAPATLRPFNESLPMALLRAREATMRLFRPMLADHDLTEQQWRVLRALAAADSPQSVGAVAETTFLLAPSLSRIVANLEQRGLIDRATSADDQRRSNLALSASGQALVDRVGPRSESTYAHIEAEFGAARLHALMSELAALARLERPAVREPNDEVAE